ncbi:hypothetical protein RR46_07090 [Papilio xuthus]|uniref:Uncharacterized protein n=1 Tax=Papilio xuthus TaxID=66420 RepID=A0A194Q668_PAPXU|nr:hypothetical protein RR46_07090 [Papilio xuthus]
MSDRGFGDQASRNVVKNPLLSTAVIGVSLEDLTHNAVLLPAVPNQELITRQALTTTLVLQHVDLYTVTTSSLVPDMNVLSCAAIRPNGVDVMRSRPGIQGVVCYSW